MKKCTGCLIIKTFTDFYKHPKAPDKLTWRCKQCLSAQIKKAYTKESRFKHKDRMLQHYHGINLEIYNSMLVQQKNKCLGCEKEVVLNVDHCHKTGNIRGLLCSKCNVALGMVDDSVEILINLTRYLNERKYVEINSSKKI